MAPTPKEESEVLLNVVFPFAEQQLQKHAEFFPFAAVMLANGEVQMLSTYDGDEQPESQSVIDDTEKAFIRGAKNNEYRATALVYMVAVRNPDTGEKEDAVCVNVDHQGDYSARVIFPYSLSNNEVQFFTPSSVKGEGKIFGEK